MADEEQVAPAAPDPVLDRDPEVLAEEKKNRIWHLKLERWKEIVKAVAFSLQTFKAEAVSLTSGIGTLVVGWFQVKKWVVQGRAETRAEGRAEGKVAGRAQERAERREDRAESSGYGSGHGRLGTSPRKAAEPVVELAPVAEAAPPDHRSMLLDPMSYLTVALPVVFVLSTVRAWIKRKNKSADVQGGK